MAGLVVASNELCKAAVLEMAGIQIDAGGTNTFYGCSFEGINAQAGPLTNAWPVAIQIAHSSLNFSGGGGGADNNGNGCLLRRQV
jgi:hypothetical protein